MPWGGGFVWAVNRGYCAELAPSALNPRGIRGTLRDPGGFGHIGRNDPAFRIIVVGQENSDPYVSYAGAIKALGVHLGFELDRDRCYPYAQR